MSPVPEKKTGKAGTVRRKRRGVMSLVAEDPMMEILSPVGLVKLEESRCAGSESRGSCPEGVDVAVGGRRTDVMMMCGTRWVR